MRYFNKLKKYQKYLILTKTLGVTRGVTENGKEATCSYSPAAQAKHSSLRHPPASVYRSRLGIKGNQVLIGTDAPEDVSIMREELYEHQSHAIEVCISKGTNN